MHVIGHQHITMDGHRLGLCGNLQRLQVTGMVIVIKKGAGTIDAAMGDVQRDAG